MTKYDRNGFKPRPRQLILTQTAAYVVEEAKIKQRVLYTSLKGDCVSYVVISVSCFEGCDNFIFCFDISGISVSSLSDGIVVFHITCEDPKQKVKYILHIWT